jgi:hypothetical protein
LLGDETAPPETRGATLSDCRTYRYHLWRVWDEDLPCLVFVMQNPSTADERVDDPTIRKCVHFARRDGYGGISVRNVFALRATDERELLTHPDPVGPLNLDHLGTARQVSVLTRLVVAWGKPFGGNRLRSHYRAAESILAGLAPYCLGVNGDGSPKHPLFLANATPLVGYREAKDKVAFQ